MERFPSIGLVELAIIAGVVGLVLLAGVIVVAVVVRKRRNGARTAGLDGADVPAPSPRRSWIWVVLVVLSVLVMVPLCVAAIVAGGALLVIPVEQTVVRDAGPEAEVYVIEQGESIDALSPAMTEPVGTPSQGAQAPGAAQPASAPPGRSTLLSLNPFEPATYIMLLGLAGLLLLLGTAAVAVLGKGRKGTDKPSAEIPVHADSQETWFRRTKLRSVLLALVLWIALSAFLILDLFAQVSLYWQFVVMYAAFWVLVGALLSTGRPLRGRLLSLGLFVLVLFSVRLVDWNTRKPFLRDFYSLKEGMTPAQVDQVMSGYMETYGQDSPQSEIQYEFDQQGEIVTGWVTYRHTNEGWGDSDWGVVTFEDGYVVRLEFLPD